MINAVATCALLFVTLCGGTQFDLKSAKPAATYSWTNLTRAADFPEGYNYPVYVFGNWMVALNNGAWLSRDGKNWSRTELPESGLNSAHQKYLQFNGAIYALGSMTGNYENFTIDTTIKRTRDFRTWETVAKNSNLPKRVFYGAIVFDNKMWLFGGYDGKRYFNDVWNSVDGMKWNRVAENAEWSPRNARTTVVFKNRIWMFGGGVIDGHPKTDPTSANQVWSTTNGIAWKRENADDSRKWGGTPVVFDDKLWLVGMNRGDGFASAAWHSSDGLSWSEERAPWSPRGAVAAWVFDGKLLMTGGKSSHTENGEIKFVYSNDVWAMERKSE